MSFSAFYTGLTGLKTHSTALNVIGNNLANVNTVGYKGSRTTFSELFSGASGGFGVNGAGVPHQVGAGVSLASVQQLFAQGSMQPSEVTTDLAIQGNGFFALRTNDDQPVYSRAGNFSFNAQGFLVNPDGYRVQGYTQHDANGNINATGQVSDISIPVGMTAAPLPSSFFELALNLNASARTDDTATATTDEAAVFSTGVTMYDAMGGEHTVTVVFRPVSTDTDAAPEQWTWEARIDKAELASPSATTAAYDVIDTGTMTFDATGQLASPTGNITLSLPNFANGAQGQAVEWRMYNTDGDPVITSYVSGSAVNNLRQDGYGMGRLSALAVSDDGIVSGVFTNGQTLQLAQVAIASFNAPEGLFRRGGNTFMASLGSGPAALGVANSGGRGKIASRSLELSNVDITDQFTELIITERGYQSNSRIITTTDAVMQEALQLKR